MVVVNSQLHLTGDFNIKPQSTMYRLLTEGSVQGTSCFVKFPHWLLTRLD